MNFTCSQCQSVFERLDARGEGNRFCSRSCAAKFNNKQHPKRKKEGKCRECGIPVASTARWCSEACKEAAQKANADRWLLQRGERVVEWRKRTKARAVAHMGGGCAVCGYNRSLWALSFHHTDPHTKDFSISGKCRSWERTLLELEKCVLLCMNCHAEVHDGTLDPETLRSK